MRKFSALKRTLPGRLPKSGRQATAAIMGTTWRKRMMSKNEGSGIVRRCTTSLKSQAAWLQAQREKPAVMSAQKLRSAGGRAMQVASMAAATLANTMNSVTSAKAVRAKLLWAVNDTAAMAAVSAAAATNQGCR